MHRISTAIEVSQPHSSAIGGRTIEVGLPLVRTRALARIMASRSQLTVLSAAPGYGKTRLLQTLAAEWSKAGMAVEWRNADNLLAWSRSEVHADAILIDDAQDAPSARLVQLVRMLVSGNTAQRFVIATRSLPEIEWLSLETTGMADVLHAEDLALDLSETGAMLRAYGAPATSPKVTRAVQRWTEGWPIAVQWHAVMSSRRKSWNADTILFRTSCEDLCRYLAVSIYETIDASTRAFLFRLAALPRFTTPMLSEILPGGPALLERALCANLMIVPASTDGRWYRLHGLFKGFLTERRQDAPADLNKDFPGAAAAWCVRAREWSDAIDCAMLSGDNDFAQELLLANAERLVSERGEIPRLLAWVERLTAEGASIAIPLRLWCVWALVLTLQIDRAEADLDAVAAAMPSDAPRRWRAHLEKLRVSIAARQDDPDAVVRLADQWMERWSDGEPFHAAAIATLRALAQLQIGARQPARRDLAIARQRLSSSHGGYGLAWLAKSDALMELLCGRVPLARTIILDGLADALASTEIAPSTIATLHLLAARILIEGGETADARQHLFAGQLYAVDNGLIDIQIATLEAAVLLAEASDGMDAALLETRQGGIPGLRYAITADLIAVTLQLRHDHGETARETFTAAFRFEGGWHHLASCRAVPEHLIAEVEEMAAWLDLAEGSADKAGRTAERLLSLCERQGSTSRHVRLLMLAAATAAMLGNECGARRHFVRGLRLAAERGLKRTVIDCGWALRALLACDDDFSGLPGDAHALFVQMRNTQGLQGGPGDAILIERLTAREAEILGLLDSGMTSKAIATHLGLGLSTAKWHMQNIYNKLQVRNRTGAVACARRLALIH